MDDPLTLISSCSGDPIVESLSCSICNALSTSLIKCSHCAANVCKDCLESHYQQNHFEVWDCNQGPQQ